MAAKSPVKLNKKHGGKEFSNWFHFVGKVKPVKEQDKESGNWTDVPYFRTETDDNGKLKKIIEFVIETAMSNDLKVKLSGKEMDYAYPYSSKHKKAATVAWEDRHDKTSYPDDTYHLIEPEWDKIDKLKELIVTDGWFEVKGKYTPYSFIGENNNEIKGVSRTINSVNSVIDGKVSENGELKSIKVNNEEIDYVCDFDSPDFVEVNNFGMQLGILSTYEDYDAGNTKVNGVYLTYGLTRSEPKDVELIVYNEEPEEGKKSLAEAFTSVERGDFLEVTGQDNNRATFTYVAVQAEPDDPFADVDETSKQTRYEKVTNGAKKGLEIKSYVDGSYLRKFLTEDEITKSINVIQNTNPSTNTYDPFSDVGVINISEDDLPF
ncbi:hypothetical protein NBRC13296_12560 [Paenibacillus chitinolyticus]|uniref:hypothetical protein n=1 Tax=Paenibacillus chitinolyticus TaxID=79263 RepID=UPI0035584302